MRSDRILLVLLAVNAAATFAHHAHNAELLEQYPNMPAWLSRPGVYAAWLGALLTGLTGYVLVQRGYRFAGLGACAACAISLRRNAAPQ